ncbi:MAG: phosphoribosylglycinamide formyltransferase [Hyphomicrobiaceae bacterium]
MSARKRVAILISGRGSNMEALIAAARDPAYPAEIALVVSNLPGVQGLDKAKAAGVPTLVVNHRTYPSRMAFEMRVHAALLEKKIDLVCNAGFMRLLTAEFVNRWRDRHLNIHPSLLPAFAGLDTHARVIDQGVRITGCTVHFVRVEMDAGPIIAQAAVPVADGDTPDTLAARVLAAEHRLYPHALALVASGRTVVASERVLIRAGAPPAGEIFSPPL